MEMATCALPLTLRLLNINTYFFYKHCVMNLSANILLSGFPAGSLSNG